MRKLHGKTKLRRMFALFLSVMLLIVNIPVKALGESIDGTDSSIIENMEDNPITENPTEEPDGDEDNPITENPTEEPDGDEDNSNIENPTEEPDSDKKDANEKDEAGAFVLDLASLNFDFSKINANEALMKFLAKDVEVDMNDPVIEQVAEELDNSDLISGNETNSGMMKRSLMTADESSETKGLTEEEKAEILEMFAGYLQNYAASAPVLGVQLPFFLNENDNEEDGLGVLGEMLVLAGNTVAEVRNGEQTYDEISGMILTLMLGDQLGVHCYEDVIIGLRDEALDAVKKSSAKTEAQKLLVLNDWLATKVAFNMSYIMNADGSESMQAEDPQPHNNYDTVYGAVYGMYKDAILEDLKNAAKEQYPYETFLGQLEQQVGEEYFASMTEDDKKAAYEDAILDILKSDEFTAQLGMPYEEFVEANAKGAADALTPAILTYWEGSIFGTLGEGSALCLGYVRAYAYLVQCLQPEIYLKEGNDLNSADNWKSNKDIYFDENNEIKTDQGYLVDAVRVTFDADVTMFGQTQENFNSDHFWNAIRVDGQWYYIDPSYNDIYVEVMLRDRVETDGNMSHLYFLLSDTTTRELYEGNYSKIKTLYEGVATDDSYEDSWMVRSISNIFSDKNYFYYVYSSQDLIDQLRESNNSNPDSSMNNDYEYKLVRHKITDDVDIANTDTDFDSLIEFNYRENEDDKESYARIWDGSEMVKDDYLTALYAEHKAMAEIYPSITISTVLKNNKLYFNLSNLILSYDLENNSCAVEKEMGTISLTRDKKVAFGGMSFSYSDGKSEGADFVLDNHPIAAIALGKGGQLKVSMATNLAYISGKDDGEYEDDLSTIRQGAYTEDREGFYGYAFEETNYNTAYSTYSSDKYEGFVNKEINDNDEFMWAANAVNQYQFSELAGTSTEGKEFIGVLCKDEEHAYVEHDEIYFTKDDDLEWNIGAAYVCVTCGHSVFEPTEPTDIMIHFYPEAEEEYKSKLAAYEAAKEESQKSYKLEGAQWADDYTSVTFSTLNCKYSFDDYQLDVLYNLKPVELDEPIVIDAITKTENDDGSITYTADSSAIEDYSGYEYYVSITVDKDVVEEKEYSVTIEDGGTNATGSGDYKKGTSVTITAGTKEGYSFKEWTSEDITITDASNETITFDMPEKNVTVKANWTKVEEEYLVTIEDGGTNASGSGDYKKGTSVTITAGTKEAYNFKEWTSEDITITDANNETITFEMPEKNVTVKANWTKVEEEEKYSVTIEDGGTNATGSGDYKKGTSVTITAGTKEAYNFKEWTSEDITITDANNETITFEMPEKNVTVKANWTKVEEEEKYSVTIEDGGTNATGSGDYKKGTSVTITAGTKEAYNFKEWTSEDITITDANNETITFEMPEKNVTVKANWTKVEEEEKYSVTIEDGGTNATGSGDYNKGTSVTITAGTKEGYGFKEWTSEDITITDANNETITFDMPEKNVTVKANWTKVEEEYLVTIEDGGTNASGSGDYKKGTSVKITAGTREGYSFKEWTSEDITITDAKNKTITFDMPEKNVTVKANWTKNSESSGDGTSGGSSGGSGGSSGSSTSTPRPTNPVVPEEVIIKEERVPLAPPYIGFKDVLENAWYYGAVRQVTTSGLFVGISKDLFGPNMAVTRGMFVTVLSRVEFGGSDKVPSGTSHFTDLSQDWYKDAVAWAAANKITYGTSDTKFSPDDLITREQMIVMIYRYAMYKDYDMSHSAGALSNFGDKNMVTKANETAMEWAIKHGLISGMNPTTLAPRGETTRAQLATVMIRFIDYSESGVSLGGFDNLPIFYKLTFETNGGSKIESVSKARGTTIKLDKYNSFRDGYRFLSWYADKELTEKITSVRLIENTTIYVKWEKN